MTMGNAWPGTVVEVIPAPELLNRQKCRSSIHGRAAMCEGALPRQEGTASKSRRQAGLLAGSRGLGHAAGGSFRTDFEPARRVNQEGKKIFAVILLSAAARPQAGIWHTRHDVRAYFPLPATEAENTPEARSYRLAGRRALRLAAAAPARLARGQASAARRRWSVRASPATAVHNHR